jgi:hypothetical protein
MPTGTWTHVAVTFNGDTATMYVNGVPAASGTAPMVAPMFGQPFCYLGKSMWNADPNFSGRLDDFRIYNYALTGKEVYSLWGGSTNHAPAFSSNPINLPAATQSTNYSTLSKTLTSYASDVDGGTLTYTKVSGPSWLTVASNGALAGTPANSDVGVNSFVVRVADSTGASDDANLYITVNNVNDAPVWSSSSLAKPVVTRDQPYVSFSLAGDASDPDSPYGDTISFSKVSGPAWLIVAADGTLSGAPGASDVGVDTFVVRVTDSSGAFNDITLSITVLPFVQRSQYSFEGDTTDALSGFNGVATGSPTYAAGRLGQAIVLDGSTSYVTLPSDVASYHDITIAAFVYWNGGNAWQRIFDFGNDTSHYLMLTPSTGSVMQFSIINGGSAQQVNSSAALPIGRWVHVAVTLSGNTGTLYVDGVAVATNTSLTINPDDFRPAKNYLGDSQYSADPLLSGRLDDFRIYNYALTAAQVFDIANPIPEVPSGLVTTGLQAKVVLTWNIAQAAQTYTVKRSLTSGGPYTTIASGITSTTYTDAGLTNGTTYYYAVSATNAKGESADSSEASGTPSDLLQRLKFDETGGTTAVDSSGNSYSATLVNSPTFVAGKLNNALNLASASSQYATLPNGFLSTLGDFTITAWVNVATFSTWARIFDFGTGTTNYMFLTPQYATGSNAAKLRFEIRTPSVTSQQLNSSIAITANTWNHIAITLSGNTATLYVNGSLAATNSGMMLRPSSLGSTTQNYLGRSQFSADPYFNGAIDDFRIYSRALSASEIATFQSSLTAPQNLAAAAGPEQAVLTWNPVTNASGYKIKRGSLSGGPYATIAGATSASYTDTGLTDGTIYYYVVSALNVSEESPDSSEVGVIPSAPISAAEKLPPVLAIASDGDSGNSATLTVAQTVRGHTYQLQYTADLANGPWQNIGSPQSGTGGDLQFVTPIVDTNPAGFYRIQVHR